MAKGFVEALRLVAPNWNCAFLRIDASEQHIGAKASYAANGEVSLMSAFRHKPFFDDMLKFGAQLRELTSSNERRFVVCLLKVDSNFDYEVVFEYDDSTKWEITKSDGASGVPSGITLGELPTVKPRDRTSPERKPWCKPW